MRAASGAPNTDDSTAATIPSVEATAVTIPTATWRRTTYSSSSPTMLPTPATQRRPIVRPVSTSGWPDRASGMTIMAIPSAITQPRVEAAPICAARAGGAQSRSGEAQSGTEPEDDRAQHGSRTRPRRRFLLRSTSPRSKVRCRSAEETDGLERGTRPGSVPTGGGDREASQVLRLRAMDISRFDFELDEIVGLIPKVAAISQIIELEPRLHSSDEVALHPGEDEAAGASPARGPSRPTASACS